MRRNYRMVITCGFLLRQRLCDPWRAWSLHTPKPMTYEILKGAGPGGNLRENSGYQERLGNVRGY